MKKTMRHMIYIPINLVSTCLLGGRYYHLSKPRSRQCTRQIAILILFLGLTSCITIPGFEDKNGVKKGTAGYIQGFYGGVAADEPYAVLVGRDILAAGGSAVDAAVAMYFMLAVTYPSAASLGGGGMCLVGDSATGKVETLDFLGKKSSGLTGVSVNIPSNPRGFYALHAKYGNLEWAEVIRPAENSARFGVRLSRASASEIRTANTSLSGTPVGQILTLPNEQRPYREGDTMIQLELAAVLATIRARGAGVLYNGTYARQIVEYAKESGAGLTYTDMQALRPLWRSALEVLFDVKSSFYLPMPRTSVGTMAAKALAASISGKRYQKSNDELRAHLMAESIQRALVDGARGFETVTPKNKNSRVRLPYDYVYSLMKNYDEKRIVQLATDNPRLTPNVGGDGQTSFVAVDKNGGTVTCFVTMNQRFGVRRAIRGTGIFLGAPPPNSNVIRDLSVGLLIMSKRNKKIFLMAGSASGGVVAQAAMVQAALRAGGGTTDDLETAIARKRIFRDPADGVTFLEKGTPLNIVKALRQRGHKLQLLQSVGRVNLIFCESGLPAKVPYCGIRSDPRGFGLASVPGS